MIKRYVLSLLFCFYVLAAGAQTDVQTGKHNDSSNPALEDTTANANIYIDTVAVMILDKMAAVLGEINEACFDLEVVYDIITDDFGLIKNSDRAKLCVKGNNKLIVDIDGDKGHRQFSYDGDIFSYYSWDKNRYAQYSYTGNTIDLIDSVSINYGLEFPGIDVFYPEFVDDAIASCTKLSHLGQTEVNGKQCFHIAGKTPVMTWQLWVSCDIFRLPVKLLIKYDEKEGSPEYEVNYNKHDLNPGLQDAIFDFNVPPNSEKIKIKPKK